MATEISTLPGSVLDRSLAEGIAVFIPVGLTAIKVDANDFFRQTTGKAPAGAFEFATVQTAGKLKFLCLIDNNGRKINSIDDMRSQIEEVLDAFASKGVKSVAMNGIHCNNRPDPTVRPEKYQRQFVEAYLAKHPDVFEKIVLVDARGGFDK